MPSIKLQVNGENHEFEAAYTVLDIMKTLGLKPEIVAVELNGRLLRKDEYDSSIVSNGDKFEHLYYMAGGEDDRNNLFGDVPATKGLITKRVRFNFPMTKVKDPVIYCLVKNFDLIPNIRRASIEAERGWMVLEVSGTIGNLKRGFDFVRSYSVDVEPIGGDVVEG